MMLRKKNSLGLLTIFFLVERAIAEDKQTSNQEHVVIQKNRIFSQSELTINIGDTIIFKNEETDVIHNVYSITPGNEFEIHHQKPGTQTPILIDSKKHRPGKMVIECAIHPTMKIVVQVKEK
jgi:plastocyanin